jgi:hypothetical protein
MLVLKTLSVQWKLEAKGHCGPPLKNITDDEIAKTTQPIKQQDSAD